MTGARCTVGLHVICGLMNASSKAEGITRVGPDVIRIILNADTETQANPAGCHWYRREMLAVRLRLAQRWVGQDIKSIVVEATSKTQATSRLQKI
jgi:hypothetical protein